ncbi:hypothetical protein A7K91_22335 [Paenibacillus oryzae]|uniref:Uncharacterized protein n=1 Tax=Paenibacillus oryzae TaxID=1844972 RepID=A0A1A5YQE6_9BACL|nr:hypothetical protein A7K91_22335 [Paenibacillus oryzae]
MNNSSFNEISCVFGRKIPGLLQFIRVDILQLRDQKGFVIIRCDVLLNNVEAHTNKGEGDHYIKRRQHIA